MSERCVLFHQGDVSCFGARNTHGKSGTRSHAFLQRREVTAAVEWWWKVRNTLSSLDRGSFSPTLFLRPHLIPIQILFPDVASPTLRGEPDSDDFQVVFPREIFLHGTDGPRVRARKRHHGRPRVALRNIEERRAWKRLVYTADPIQVSSSNLIISSFENNRITIFRPPQPTPNKQRPTRYWSSAHQDSCAALTKQQIKMQEVRILTRRRGQVALIMCQCSFRPSTKFIVARRTF